MRTDSKRSTKNLWRSLDKYHKINFMIKSNIDRLIGNELLTFLEQEDPLTISQYTYFIKRILYKMNRHEVIKSYQTKNQDSVLITSSGRYVLILNEINRVDQALMEKINEEGKDFEKMIFTQETIQSNETYGVAKDFHITLIDKEDTYNLAYKEYPQN
jgi:hypothetical protein